MNTENETNESRLAMLAALLVILVALLNPVVAGVLALCFVGVLFVYEFSLARAGQPVGQ